MNIITAFVAGVLSFLSPCILPLLPSYLSMLTGQTLSGNTDMGGLRRRAVIGAIFFGLGFSIVFIALGAVSTGLGRFLATYKDIFYTIMGVIVIILGMHMLDLLRASMFYKERRFHLDTRKYAPFIIGVAFAFGWTPCVGPILGGILTMAAQKETLVGGMVLLSAYSLGLWIPFLITALFTAPVMSFLAKYPNLSMWAQRIAGALLILMGVLLVSGQLTLLTNAVLNSRME